ncbi:MAG: cysteine desulfurase [Clostridiales bacterium]|nr:cysteine desulfurase [Clostridiales bacterium]
MLKYHYPAVSCPRRAAEKGGTLTQAYLDNSATTRVCEEAAQEMLYTLTEGYGNPSSLHAKGFEAEQLLKKARARVAKRIGCEPEEVFFTSGGTEANNLALFGVAQSLSRRGRRIVTTAIEHPSVEKPLQELEKQGFEVIYLPAGEDGKVQEKSIFEAVNGDTILVSMMAVNNEVGSLQPLEAVRRAIKRTGAPALFHCDCVQGFGKLDIKPSALGIDLMTVSAHKIHGPKGAGALYVRRGVQVRPRTFGGGQEKDLRPGTEAMPALVGFGAAAQALPDVRSGLAHATQLRDYLLEQVSGMRGVTLNSPPDALPYIVNLSLPGLRSEPILNLLSEMGVYVSSGSACAKGHKSHVLTALGLPNERIDSALRISFSRFTTPQEIDALVAGLRRVQQVLRRV